MPMELWQLDIVDGIRLADGSETKIVTGVDDHSRYCVIASVVRRATGRAVCLAFADALTEFGVPEEVLTDIQARQAVHRRRCRPLNRVRRWKVDRTVNRFGSVSLGQHLVLAADILGGRRVGIRIDGQTLSFFDLDTRQLLRTRPNRLTAADISRLRGVRPAGPPPAASQDPVQVQRRVSTTGVVMVARQTVALGRVHAGKTVTIDVTDTELVVACDDGPRTVRRTTDHPVRNLKVSRPREVSRDV
jgi:hypothetical protein